MSEPLPPPPSSGSPPPGSPPGSQPAPPGGGWTPPAPSGPPPPPAWGPQPSTSGASWATSPAAAKPPRPRVVPAVALIVIGAIGMVVGTFLPWVTGDGGSASGWDLADLSNESNDAGVYVAIAVILTGLAVAMAVAGRMLAVAIIAVVVAAFATLAAIIDIGDDEGLDFLGLRIGAGLYVILVAALVALAGSIWALAVRRR